MAYKQHFIEWFSGKQLPSYWTKETATGSGTGAMADEVDGGFKLTITASSYQHVNYHFNNKRQYANDGSVLIATIKDYKVGSSGGTIIGFVGNTGISPSNSAYIQSDLGATSWIVYSHDGSSQTGITLSKSLDTNWFNLKVECGSSDVKISTNAVLDTTKTTNLPSAKIMPNFSSMTGGGSTGAEAVGIRYMECYNT